MVDYEERVAYVAFFECVYEEVVVEYCVVENFMLIMFKVFDV